MLNAPPECAGSPIIARERIVMRALTTSHCKLAFWLAHFREREAGITFVEYEDQHSDVEILR